MEVISLLLLFSLIPVRQSIVVGTCKNGMEGSKCTAKDAFWQYDGVCKYNALEKSICHVPETRHFSFRLIAVIEQFINTNGAMPIKKLWVKGAGPSLSWEKATEMKKVREGHWALEIRYTYDSNALLCLKASHCSLNQKALEFRVYRDEHGQDGMLGPNIYIPLPVSNSISGSLLPSVPFYPWFDGRHVFTKNFTFYNHLHFVESNRRIKISIFYPPSFKHNVYKRYPVVITFGSTLIKQIVPLLESMYTWEASIEEAVVLSVHNKYMAPYCEFNPFSKITVDPAESGVNRIWKCPADEYEICEDCMDCLDIHRSEFCDSREFSEQAERCDFNPYTCPGRADAILDNLENIVLPEMAVNTLGRLLIDYPKERISVIGIDGAGALACYAALSRPLMFKNAACLSAPFHWPLTSIDERESRKKQGIGLFLDEISQKMNLSKEYQVLYSTQKYFIDVGERDNVFLPIVDTYNYSDWVVEELKSRLKLDPENLLYYKNVLRAGNSIHHLREHGDHRMVNRIKLPLLYFLKPEGGLDAEHPRSPKITSKDYIKRRKTHNFTIVTEPVIIEQDSPENCKEKYIKKSKTVSVSVYVISIGKYKIAS